MSFATKVTQLHTRVRARVYRHDADPIEFVGDVDTAKPSIVGVSTSKSLAGVGTFTLTMKAPRRFLVSEEIQSGDWIVWWWEINGRAYHGTFGPITNVGRSRTSVGGATAVEFPVTCADFTRVIERTQVWFDDFSDYETNVGGKITGSRMGYTPTGSPDAVIENVLDAFLGKSGIIGGAWVPPRGMDWIGEYFVQGLKISVSSTLGGADQPHFVGGDHSLLSTKLRNGVEVLAPGTPLLRGEVFGPEIAMFNPAPGTMLMQHVAGLSNDLLNEVFYDVLTEAEDLGALNVAEPVPCISVRERPFPNQTDGLSSPWWKLPTVRRARNEGLLSDSVTSSDDERINLILLYGSSLGTGVLDQYALHPPSYHRNDIARHGIRKFERSTPFAGFGESPSGTTWTKELETWCSLVASWYGLNHRWLAGSMSFAGVIPDARVGRRFIVDDDNDEEREQFYIESVAHQWRYPSAGSTSVGVTRGWRGTDEALVGAVADRAAGFQREQRGGEQAVVVEGPSRARLESLR